MSTLIRKLWSKVQHNVHLCFHFSFTFYTKIPFTSKQVDKPSKTRIV